MKSPLLDVAIVGSGPNGLAAAIALAQAGFRVTVYEAKETFGGGMRSAAFTLPDFVHDVCSAVFPMAIASPFLQTLPLEKYGLEWSFPDIAVAHPFTDGTAAVAYRSLDATCDALTRRDAAAYRRVFQPFVRNAEKLWHDLLAPLRIPRHPFALARFGGYALLSAAGLAKRTFHTPYARALFAGTAAHSFLPLTQLGSAAIGLVLLLSAHATGWPIAIGGAQKITDAMVQYGRSLSITFIASHPIEHIDALPRAKAYVFDVSPHQLAHIAASRLPAAYCKKLLRFRYGPSAFKIDWALTDPIPWRAQTCRSASTVHVCGGLEEIIQSEAHSTSGRLPSTPFMLVSQPSVFDPSRAPVGKHTAWAYAHVPFGFREHSNEVMVDILEKHIERFAPGFRDTIPARHTMSPMELEAYNPNYIGGHIVGGSADLAQLWTRPVSPWNPYATPNPTIFICSASTPPGGGVHGMCGYHAAQAVMKKRLLF